MSKSTESILFQEPNGQIPIYPWGKLNIGGKTMTTFESQTSHLFLVFWLVNVLFARAAITNCYNKSQTECLKTTEMYTLAARSWTKKVSTEESFLASSTFWVVAGNLLHSLAYGSLTPLSLLSSHWQVSFLFSLIIGTAVIGLAPTIIHYDLIFIWWYLQRLNSK